MQLHHGLLACLGAQRVHVPALADRVQEGHTAAVAAAQRPRARTLSVFLPDPAHSVAPFIYQKIFSILVCPGQKINPFRRAKQIFRNSPETGRVFCAFSVKIFLPPPHRRGGPAAVLMFPFAGALSEKPQAPAGRAGPPCGAVRQILCGPANSAGHRKFCGASLVLQKKVWYHKCTGPAARRAACGEIGRAHL